MTIKWSELSDRERDALVHDKIIGKDHQYRAPLLDWPGRYIRKGAPLTEWHKTQRVGEWEYYGPHYTTSIVDVWMIICKFKQWHLTHLEENKYQCEIWDVAAHDWTLSNAETAPEAICLAALNSVGCEVRNDS